MTRMNVKATITLKYYNFYAKGSRFGNYVFGVVTFASDISGEFEKSKLYLQLETKLCLLYLKQLKNGKHQNDYYNKLLEILKHLKL